MSEDEVAKCGMVSTRWHQQARSTCCGDARRKSIDPGIDPQHSQPSASSREHPSSFYARWGWDFAIRHKAKFGRIVKTSRQDHHKAAGQSLIIFGVGGGT
jgi:hypothetical protein